MRRENECPVRKPDLRRRWARAPGLQRRGLPAGPLRGQRPGSRARDPARSVSLFPGDTARVTLAARTQQLTLGRPARERGAPAVPRARTCSSLAGSAFSRRSPAPGGVQLAPALARPGSPPPFPFRALRCCVCQGRTRVRKPACTSLHLQKSNRFEGSPRLTRKCSLTPPPHRIKQSDGPERAAFCPVLASGSSAPSPARSSGLRLTAAASRRPGASVTPGARPGPREETFLTK